MSAGMRMGQLTPRHVRPVAAPVLLAVYVLAAILAPVGHLATHRNDHTHGPELASGGDPAHEAAHRTGRPHHHATPDEALTAAERAWLEGGAWPAEGEGAGPADGTAPSDGTARYHGTPAHDHGRDSVAHFALAIVQGPPPPMVPPPGETQAPAPDLPLRGYDAPALPHPPVRGPPTSPTRSFRSENHVDF